VYAKKDYIILDDVFSGLDAETEEQVFSRLLGNQGLFRKAHTTVLLVTHAVHRLSYSDHIIALDSTGRIAVQGSFEQLRFSGGYVESLAAESKSQNESEENERVIPAAAVPLFSAEIEDLDTIAEELGRQTGDFGVYKYYFGSVGWRQTAIFLGLAMLNGTSSKMTEFLITFCKYLEDCLYYGQRAVNVGDFSTDSY